MHANSYSNDVIMNDVHSFDDVIMHYDNFCNYTKLNILDECIQKSFAKS
jgi:hypothetical protein